MNLATIFQSPYYYFNISSLLPFVFCNLAFFIGLFVLATGARFSFHRSIFYYYLACTLWFLAYALTLNAWIDPVTFFWGRITYFGIILLPATLLHISLVVADQYARKRIFLWIVYLGVFILFMKASIDPLFIGIDEYPWGFSPRAQDAHAIFLVFSLACYIYALFTLCAHYLRFRKLPQRRRMDKPYRRKLEFVLAAFGLTALSNLSVLNYYGISVHPLGPIVLFGAMMTMGYALIKYHNAAYLAQLREIGKQVKVKGEQVLAANRQVQAARLKLADMGKASIFASLSAGILHQMCQPITAVHGLVKFLKSTMKPDDPYFKSIDLIYEQSAYVKEMLNDLMEIVRHREVRKENVDINECLDRTLRLLRDELRIKRINWDLIPGENLPKVFGDSIHFQQIFMNIIVNAMEALALLPRGEKRYFRIASHFKNSTREVIVNFENIGPQLTPDQKKKMFEPFHTNRETGTGIGLALCKDLASEHHGDIEVENFDDPSLGKGVRFSVKLPAVIA